MNDSRASDVIEACLGQLNQSLLTRDFEAFAQVVTLPYEVQCFDGKLCCDSPAVLEAMFARVCAYYCRHAITDLIRIPREISQVAPDLVHCLYETRPLTAQNLLAEEPFFCLTEVVRVRGQWRMRRSQYDIVPGDVRHGVIFGTVAEPAARTPGPAVGAC